MAFFCLALCLEWGMARRFFTQNSQTNHQALGEAGKQYERRIEDLKTKLLFKENEIDDAEKARLNVERQLR